MPSGISRHLIERKTEIVRVWEALVRTEVPGLAGLDREAVIDHLPEFIEGLARWTDGDTGAARRSFATLAEGHALQRLGYGIDLVTLTREYMLLRSTILRDTATLHVPRLVEEIALAHGAYCEPTTNAISIRWPRARGHDVPAGG